MDKMIRMNLKTSLECAVTVIDDFSNKVLKGSQITVVTDSVPERKSIPKNDGFFLFLKADTPVKRIKISGSIYATQFIDVDTSKLERQEPTIKIYAKPNRAYPFPSGTTIISGKALAGQEVSVILKTSVPSLTLLKDYSDTESSEIMVFATDKGVIEGKKFGVLSKTGKITGSFVIKSVSSEKGKYFLENPLSAKLTKSTAKIYRIYNTVADDRGDYILAIKEEVDGDCNFLISSDEKKWAEHPLVTSKYNMVDLI